MLHVPTNTLLRIMNLKIGGLWFFSACQDVGLSPPPPHFQKMMLRDATCM